MFSTIVNNPYLFLPVVLQGIILPANAYLWMQFDWASLHTQMFAMNFLPNAVSAYFLSNGDFRNVMLVIVNLILAAIIWYPFFKVFDKHAAEDEAKSEADLAAKKAAKRAAREAKRAAKKAAQAAGAAEGDAALAVAVDGAGETADVRDAEGVANE